MTVSYVEMLEQQQSQLVAGLQELYGRIVRGQGWMGPRLDDGDVGPPRTHDILDRLGVLTQSRRSDRVVTTFEEDLNALQRRLYESGAPPMLRHRSLSLDSDLIRSPTVDTTSPPRLPIRSPDVDDQLPPTPPASTELLGKSSTSRRLDDPPIPPPSTTEDAPMVDAVPHLPDPWPSSTEGDDGLDLLPPLPPPTNLHLHPARPLSDALSDLSGLGPEWTETDDEFKALFNQFVA